MITRKNKGEKIHILHEVDSVSYEEIDTKKYKIKCIDDEGRTPLMMACIHCKLDDVKKYMSEINETDDDGWTALMYASHHGHLSVVIFLVKNGANVHKRTHSGLNASQLAYFNGHYEIFQWLDAIE